MRTVDERIGSIETAIKAAANAVKGELRVAMPGIVEAYDSVQQTVTVQLAIREKVRNGDNIEDMEIPVLMDVPVVFPRAGGYALFAVPSKGDECLIVFSDLCIDSWWQSGGIQNQAELRRHDFSDGIAIMGLWSQVNKIKNAPPKGMAMIDETSGASIVVSDGTVKINADHVFINGSEVSST